MQDMDSSLGIRTLISPAGDSVLTQSFFLKSSWHDLQVP